MYDHELTLIRLINDVNEIGDPIIRRRRRTILCDKQSITRSEHYQAAAHGFKPELVFIINKWDYRNEQMAEFGGKEYTIRRTYEPKGRGMADMDKLELICEGAVNRGSP